ncbi:MAG: hypothetical protein QOI03_1714 [Solirubrobacteraceae bacterium]|jgi:hypothetical protein|nr:hypothetical protein [Solirubrobacteraceae bacterium]
MGVETGSWTGRAEMAKAWRATMSAYHGLRVVADECRERDDERVLALHSFGGWGKTSGIDLERAAPKGAILFHLRRGKVTRLVIYPDRECALADLGVERETDASST